MGGQRNTKTTPKNSTEDRTKIDLKTFFQQRVRIEVEKFENSFCQAWKLKDGEIEILKNKLKDIEMNEDQEKVHLQNKIKTLKLSLESMDKDLKEKSAEAERFRNHSFKKSEKLKNYKQILEERDETIEQLENKIGEKNDKKMATNDKANEMDELREETEKLKKYAYNKSAKLKEFKQYLEERDEEINQLKDEIDEKNDKISQLENKIETKDFQINELEAESDKSGDEQESKQFSVEYNQEEKESDHTDSPNLLDKINSFMKSFSTDSTDVVLADIVEKAAGKSGEEKTEIKEKFSGSGEKKTSKKKPIKGKRLWSSFYDEEMTDCGDIRPKKRKNGENSESLLEEENDSNEDATLMDDDYEDAHERNLGVAGKGLSRYKIYTEGLN